ncbi:unnamed protein product [Diplocarpon coronariae]
MSAFAWRSEGKRADTQYEAVHESDHESVATARCNTYESAREPKYAFHSQHCILLLLLAVSTLSGIIGFYIARIGRITIELDLDKLEPLTQPRAPLSCGSSPSEAEALGCVYDALAANWVHNSCPRDYHDEFYYYQGASTPFIFYRDRNGTQPMTWEELGRNGEYWSSTLEHAVHCSFILKRAVDVVARGGRLDNLTGSHKHAAHCTDYLREHLGESMERLEEIHTYGTIGFLTC